jgi:hypothetical protein
MDISPATEFKNRGYIVIPSLVADPALQQLHDYVVAVCRLPYALRYDTQVPGVPAVYGDRIMDCFLEELLPVVEEELEVSLFPTFSYFRVYRTGDVLRQHRDRPACEVSVTLSLGSESSEPWPIWMKGSEGPQAIALQRGDAVIYQGHGIAHWREKFEGNYAAQVTLHYVDQHGPHREWKFDKRAALGERVATPRTSVDAVVETTGNAVALTV